MSENISKQLVHPVISANKSSIQIDESIYNKNNVQLMIFIRYQSTGDICEEFLFFEFLLRQLA